MEVQADSAKNVAQDAVATRDAHDEEANSDNPAAMSSANTRPECFKSTLQEVLFVLSATMAIGMTSILSGSITVTSAFIGRSLAMTTAEITWLYASSSLSSGAFLLFFGMVADLFGLLRS